MSKENSLYRETNGEINGALFEDSFVRAINIADEKDCDYAFVQISILHASLFNTVILDLY